VKHSSSLPRRSTPPQKRHTWREKTVTHIICHLGRARRGKYEGGDEKEDAAARTKKASKCRSGPSGEVKWRGQEEWKPSVQMETLLQDLPTIKFTDTLRLSKPAAHRKRN
jgi:hypothetical protein